VKEIDWVTPTGHTVFCDDIRQEANGKRLFVGVYGTTMFVRVSEFPVILPTLAFHVTYVDEPGVELPPLTLKIYFPGDEEETPSFISEFPEGFPPPEQRAAVHALQQETDENLKFAMAMPIVLNMVELTEPGSIRVRMQRGDELVRLGRLHVVAAPVPPETEAEAKPE
jgi:hypothetical protein